jgi:hypothetical protein
MRSLLLILGLFTLTNFSFAASAKGPPRVSTPQVDLGYEIHTGFLNVKTLRLTLNSTY